MATLGSTLFQASIQIDSRDSGVVVEKPAERFPSLSDARSWIEQETQALQAETWNASIIQGQVIDPIGSRNRADYELQPTALHDLAENAGL